PLPDDQPDAAVDEAGTASLDQAITDWSDTAKNAAHALVQSYGQPDATADTTLTWTSRGPWKRMIVHRDEVKHSFPVPHSDVVEQARDLKSPPDKIGAVALFDGSVVVSRTSGELTVWGPDEHANFGLVNLTYDIATGAKTPDEARQDYTDATTQAASGQAPAI